MCVSGRRRASILTAFFREEPEGLGPCSALAPRSPTTPGPSSSPLQKRPGGGNGAGGGGGTTTRGKARAAWATSYIHTQALFQFPPAMTLSVSGYAGPCMFTPQPRCPPLAHTAFFLQNGVPGRPSSDFQGAHEGPCGWNSPHGPLCSQLSLGSSSESPHKQEEWRLVHIHWLTLHPERAAPSPPSPASIAELGGGPHSCP